MLPCVYRIETSLCCHVYTEWRLTSVAVCVKNGDQPVLPCLHRMATNQCWYGCAGNNPFSSILQTLKVGDEECRFFNLSQLDAAKLREWISVFVAMWPVCVCVCVCHCVRACTLVCAYVRIHVCVCMHIVIYIAFVFERFSAVSPCITLCGRLGSKHQLTNQPANLSQQSFYVQYQFNFKPCL